MGFLDPGGLLWMVALLALVAIYLRLHARSTLKVSSLMLFDYAPAPTSSMRHLRIDPLFWLEAAALAALVLAIAGMYAMVSAQAGRGRSHALVFELGAAMGARDGGSTRVAEARRAALALVKDAPVGDQFSVITYALEARVVTPQTANLAAVRAAIHALRPRAVAAKPAALGAAIIRARGSSTIDLFTARTPPADLLAGSPGQAAVRVHRVGHDDDNLAIVELDGGVPGSTKGRAEVHNFSATPQLAEFAIELDGKTVIREPLMFAPREQLTVHFGPLTSGGVVHARILTADAIAADNDRYAIARGDAAARVLVLSPDAEVRADLARVLIAMNPDFQVETVAPGGFSATPGAKPFKLVVMHDCYVGGINSDATLLIFPPASGAVAARVPGLKIEGTAPRAVIRSARNRTAGSGTTLGPTRVIQFPEWMTPISFAMRDAARGPFPIIAAGSIPSGRIGIVAYDVRAHFLLDPDRLDALIDLVNVVRQITASVRTQIVSTGQYVTIPSAGAARVTKPDGSVQTLASDRWGRVKFMPLEAGRYLVESKGESAIVFANYYDAAESDLVPPPAVRPTAEPGPSRAAASAYGPRQVFPLRTVLIALALVAFMIESLLLIRRGARFGATHV